MTFKKGDRVKYVPRHAHGDLSHADCETGVVSSIGDNGTVFVKYDRPHCKMLTGDEDITAQGTDECDLYALDDVSFAELWNALA